MRLLQHILIGNGSSLARIMIVRSQSNRINRDMVGCFKGSILILKEILLQIVGLSKERLSNTCVWLC